jgi:hypothetical protein
MFYARLFASTNASEVRFQVVDFAGDVRVITRDPVKAVKIAALMNADEPVTASVLYG